MASTDALKVLQAYETKSAAKKPDTSKSTSLAVEQNVPSATQHPSSKTFSFSNKAAFPDVRIYRNGVATVKPSTYKSTKFTTVFETLSPFRRGLQHFNIPVQDAKVSEFTIILESASAKYDCIPSVTNVATSDFQRFFRRCTWSTAIVITSHDSSTAERFSADLIISEAEMLDCKMVRAKDAYQILLITF
uniref:Uncharacterized protein n=1 Tax=Panagrolaimus superbus TaxID=310955 RepID=A0A914YPP9_9BILA